VRLSLLLRVTSAISFLGAVLFFAAAASGLLSLGTVLVPMMIFSVGVGASGPVAVTNAISTDPQMIGAASGLYGFMQITNDALRTLAVGFFPANPALSAASVLLAGILLGQYFFLRPTRTPAGASA
jgi:DHA1 family bicyclomycin/chloramphenicol resistance-like MFS transporter